MAIKMRVNIDKGSKCSSCNAIWENVSEMYDVRIGKITFPLCRKCVEQLFQKTLKASCLYNAKTKSKEDMARISRELMYSGEVGEGTMSVTEALRGIKTED